MVPMVRPAMGQVSADRFAGMPVRSIGSGGTTGRITAIDAVVSDPDVVYVGAANGGLWKSANGGQTWRAIFEDQPVSNIGAVAVNQASSDIVWVGIGGQNPAKDPRVASVYRSLDAGETWTAGGLEGLEGVDRILLHPTNPEIAFAAVSGSKWEAGADRGIYKTTDGGRTWIQVLFVDETTAVSDLVMDPSDPDRLLAAMWSRRTSPWFVDPRGPGSGLFLTRDGAQSWIRLEEGDGIPGGDLGRIELDVFIGDPRVVHALVDAGEGVLLRSYNSGRTWQTVVRSPQLTSSVDDPSGIVGDPANESRLFHLSSGLSVSDDGGQTFAPLQSTTDAGYRVLWIHPENTRLMYAGTDRGLFVSRDAGGSWGVVGRLPIGRFNHAAVDMRVPFNVFGGLEGSGSWMAPAYGRGADDARSSAWMALGAVDDFGILIDSDESSRGYVVGKGGDLIRFNLETGERKRIRPWAPTAVDLRLNEDAPIALDPHDPAAIYYGSQFVHKSINRGQTWQIISADLTANDPAGRREAEAETAVREVDGLLTNAPTADGHRNGGATITVIAPSPVDPDLIWVGTDEGDVQLTRSAGGEWESVRRRIDDVPDSSWVAHIEPSVFQAGSAIVAFDGHRSGNREPLIFRTDNYGRDWRRIARSSDMRGFVHTVKQDVVAQDLLFAGTEAGLYVSLNAGEDWFHWKHGLPTVPVHDLVLHSRDHDLVIATHGRGAYILDDIRPLRELAAGPRIAEVDIFLFELPPTFIRAGRARADDGPSVLDRTVAGQERSPGVLLTYWLGANETAGMASSRSGAVDSGGADDSDGADDSGGVDDSGGGGGADTGVTIEILDFYGEVVRTLQGPAEHGMNRVAWDLQEDPPTLSGGLARFSDAALEADVGALISSEVLPGLFTVRISTAGREALQWLEVQEDPRLDIELVDRIAKYQAVNRGADLDSRLRALLAAISSVQQELDRVGDRVRNRGSSGDLALLESSLALGDELRELADFRSVIRHRAGVMGLTSSYDRPTEGQRLDLIRMEEELDALTLRIGDFLILEINRFASEVDAAGLDASFFIGPIG